MFLKFFDFIFKTLHNQEENQYLLLIKKIMANGYINDGRNGITKSIFGEYMRFSLQNNKIPLLTTKHLAWKACLTELLWFIKGETDNTILQKQGVHIWNANSTRAFLDSRGLYNNKEGMLGPIYGYQWRFFNKDYNPFTGKQVFPKQILPDEKIKENIDQLQYIIDQLNDPSTRNSRRLIMTAWNPSQLNEMALPPCHILCQFNVHDGNKLSCSMYQRSGDVGLGVPFNIASYSFLTHILAKHCNLEAFEFVYFLGNAHIYEQHIPALNDQLIREPFEFPTLEIINKKENINDYSIADFKIYDYKYHPSIKMQMIA
jgi:thymidylate synthase